MRKFVLIVVAAGLGLGSASAYLAFSRQHRHLAVEPGAPGLGPISIDQVDHLPWDRLLKKYVDRNGRVDYQSWHEARDDRGALSAYLQTLSQADPVMKASREATLAFWINAYNALTVQGILEVYPTKSIRDHTAIAFGYNLWRDLLLPVGGKRYSLHDIEHSILRKMDEPRIHFCIVCASIGCPRLLASAYRADELEEQMTRNTRDFFASPERFQIDVEKRRVMVSPILQWFRADFGPTPQEALLRFADDLPEPQARQIVREGRFRVSYLDYDWSLNGQ